MEASAALCVFADIINGIHHKCTPFRVFGCRAKTLCPRGRRTVRTAVEWLEPRSGRNASGAPSDQINLPREELRSSGEIYLIARFQGRQVPSRSHGKETGAKVIQRSKISRKVS